MKYFLFGVLFFLSATVLGQKKLSKAQFKKDSAALMVVPLVKPQFRFDNRVTFYKGQLLSINGLDAGVLMKEKLRLTLGYYRLQDQLKAFDEIKGDENYGRLIRLDYGSLNTEIIYKNITYFSFGMPLELAIGSNSFQNKNITTGEIISTEKGALMFVNFGLSATFKPTRFMGLKGILGFRKVVFNQVDNFNFDGFFTGIGLNIDMRTVIADFKLYRLKKRYKMGDNLSNAVDIITD